MDINTHSTLKTSLAAYWTLDSNFNDSHSGAHHGTFYNTPTFPVAKLRTGASLNGTTQYGRVAANAAFQTTSVALSFWFKINSLPAGDVYLFDQNDGGFSRRFVKITSTGRMVCGFPGTTYTREIYQEVPYVVAGKWYHVLAVNNAGAGNCYFYLNTVSQGGGMSDTSPVALTSDMYFGRDAGNTVFFNGVIDDFGYWTRYVDYPETVDLYQSGIGITWDGTFTCIENHPTLRSGLLAHHRFDGNANDTLGVYNGTAYGTPPPSYALGKIGQGVVFDGTTTGQRIMLPTGLSPVNPTVVAWTKRTNGGNTLGHIYGQRAGATIDYQLRNVSDTSFRWAIAIGGVEKYLDIACTDENWHLLVGTHDGTNIKFSMDNSAFTSAAASGSCDNAVTAVSIGASADSNYKYKGSVDSAIIYDRPLAQSEVTDLYNSGNGLPYSAPAPASGTFVSFQTGNWSSPNTWGQEVYPGDNSTVTVSTGHTVTVDGSHTCGTSPTNDTTMVLTVQDTGWLKWADSPAANWTFTIKGNVSVVKGGKLSIGTASNRIPSNRTALVSMPAVNTTGWKMLIGGTFEVYGAEAYHMADATKQRSKLKYNLMSGTGTTLTLEDAVDWQAGDRVHISNMYDYANREGLVIQSKIDAYTYTVNPTYCHSIGDFAFLGDRNVRFEGYDNAGRGVSTQVNITASADCDAAKLDLNWCSFKYWGKTTGTAAGCQPFYFYIVVGNTPNKSIPGGNFNLKGVVVDDPSNHLQGVVWVESDLAFTGSAWKTDGLHITTGVNYGVRIAVDGFFNLKDVSIARVNNSANFYGVNARNGDVSIDGAWVCGQWQNASMSALIGHYRSVKNSTILGTIGLYYYLTNSGNDNYRYMVNESIVDNCQFLGTLRGVYAWTANVNDLGMVSGIFVKNCEFYSSYAASVATYGCLGKLRVENCTFDGIGNYSNTDYNHIQLGRPGEGAIWPLLSATIARCTFGRYNLMSSNLFYGDSTFFQTPLSVVGCDIYQPWAITDPGYLDWLQYALFRVRQSYTGYDERWAIYPPSSQSAIGCRLFCRNGSGKDELFSVMSTYRKNLLGAGSEIREQRDNLQTGRFALRVLPFSPNTESDVNWSLPIQVLANPNKRITASLKFKNIGVPLRGKAGLKLIGPGIRDISRVSATGDWETITVQGDCNPDVTEGVKHLSSVVGNLVGYWGLNGNALDSHTNDLDGTIEGGPLTYYQGRLDKAASFNGSSQNINIGTDSRLCPANITVCGWVKKNSGTGVYEGIIAKRYEYTGVDEGWWINFSSTYWEAGVMTSARDQITLSSFVDTNWHFVALAYDGTTIRFCFDGIVYSKTHSNPGSIIPGTNVPMMIGCYVTDPKPTKWRYFNGRVSDVSLFDRALTNTEILSIYCSGRGLRYELIQQYSDPAIVNLILASGMNNYDPTQRGYTEVWVPGRVLPYQNQNPTRGNWEDTTFKNYVDVDALTISESEIP